MFCQNCGNQMKDTAAFCPRCGYKNGAEQAENSLAPDSVSTIDGPESQESVRYAPGMTKKEFLELPELLLVNDKINKRFITALITLSVGIILGLGILAGGASILGICVLLLNIVSIVITVTVAKNTFNHAWLMVALVLSFPTIIGAFGLAILEIPIRALDKAYKKYLNTGCVDKIVLLDINW